MTEVTRRFRVRTPSERPISDEARDWFAEHVGEAEYGGIYTCDPRMSEDILQAAARDLLDWQ